MLRIDIGCGTERHQDCNVGLDKHDFAHHYEEGGFIQHDILDPLPFEAGSVDWIYCNHVLEHLVHRHPTRDIDTLIFVINEFNRVLKVGSEAFIVVPWIKHTNAWRHPTHYRFFNYDIWGWFDYRNPTPDHEADGLTGEMWVIRNEIVDECHVVAVLRKVS